MAKHLTVNDGDTVKVMTGLTVSQLPTPVNDTAASDLTYVTFSTNNVKAYAEIDAYGVEYIPDNKFNGDTSVTSVIFSNKLNEIGVSSFEGCSNLTGSLTIPDSVTSIGDSAFYNCSSLTAIYVNAPEEIWGTNSLFNTGSGSIYVTSAYISSYGTPFQGHPVVEWTSYPDPMP